VYGLTKRSTPVLVVYGLTKQSTPVLVVYGLTKQSLSKWEEFPVYYFYFPV